MLKQMIVANFESVVTRFGPPKIPKCLENGPFWDQKWVKNGSRTRFSKSDPGPLGVHKQSKQARHHSVLATAPSQRLGLNSTLAILEPRWWPCHLQVLSQKLTGGASGRGRQVGRCPPKTAHFVPQNSLFWPTTAPMPNQNGQTRPTVPTLHVRLDCPVTKSPFLPFRSTICPRNSPKNGQKWPKCALFVLNRPETKNGAYLGLRGSKPNSEGT